MKLSSILASTCAAALLNSACTDGGDTDPDAGDAAPGSPDAGGTNCFPVIDGSPELIEDPEQDHVPAPTWVWTGDGMAGVWPGVDGQGYRVLELDPQGRTRVAARTLWASERGPQSPVLAVSGDVLAIVDQEMEGSTQRPTCRFALARLDGEDPIQAPTRFSDMPDEGSVLNEVMACAVGATADGFVVVWQQIVSNTAEASRVFARRVAHDGTPLGERLTIASAASIKLRGSLSVTSDATRVAVVHPTESGLGLSFVEADAIYERSLVLPGIAGELEALDLRAAHQGFVARAGDRLWLLDHDAAASHGPVSVDSRALVGPLESGYVSVVHDEFLVASGLDRELASRTAPVGISTNRGAAPHALVYAPDGSSTALLYGDADKLLLAKLACSEQPPPPPGPAACPEQASLQPLDDDCSDAICHVAVRLDYLTLGVLGWQVTGSAANMTDADSAREAARAVFDEHGEYLSGEIEMSGPEAGLFTAYMSPGDFGAFALVGEDSGAVVAAGGIVWSGHGNYWLPSVWRPGDQIACGDAAVMPELTHLASGSCAVEPEEASPPTASDALALVLRSNLAAHVAAQGPFSAFVYLYTPSVGGCAPGAAEYLVVLSQARQ